MRHGMHRISVRLPDDLNEAVTELAAARGMSKAELIRAALRALAAQPAAPRPRLPLFKSGKPGLSEGVGEALSGHGHRGMES